MFKNILKITLRNFIKERFYATINISGLAMGIATTLLIVSYVIHETSYDKDYEDVDRLFRVNMTNIWMPEGGEWGSTIPPLAKVLAEYPEVEAVMRINTPGGNIIRVNNDGQEASFYEDDILAADSNFFSIFNFKLLYGNPHTALNGVNKMVISKEMAQKYFGTKDVLGKTLLYGENKTAVEITGITATQPTNRHFDFDFLISMPTNPAFENIKDTWIATQVVTYVKFRPGTNIKNTENKMSTIAPTYAGSQLAGWGMDYDEFMEGKSEWLFYLQPIKNIHLGSATVGNRLGSVSDSTYMYIFSFTALFIMLLAIINFVNLSTARATIRAKEVGVRKVLGSLRKQLILQFLLESVLLCFVAGVVALGIAEFMKLGIEQYLGSVFTVTNWHHYTFYLVILAFLILVGLAAGVYPAVYLTAFKPSKVLKGQLRTGHKSKWFRNTLVILQFSISTALMICTFIVYQQLNYFNNKDLGYNKDNILVINWAEKLGKKLESFQHEILEHPGVINASVSMDAIGRGQYEDIFRDESSGLEQSIAMMKADERLLNTMGLKLIYGRFFKKYNAADKDAIVINESTMKLFGYTPENVLGKRIIYGGDDMGPARVIGVVKDFHFYSLHFPIAPYVFYNINSTMWGHSRVLVVKTNKEGVQPLLKYIKQAWESRVDAPFDYSFLDLDYEQLYQNEQQLGALFATFTGIALIIACLGLFGLASYTVNQRSKEIGIRKALGATVGNIMVQFNGSFTRLVIIALIIALPVAWWAMDSWLEQFAYRVNMNWWVFILTGGLAIVIAWLTVSYQSVKAALLNPVDTLKDE